MLCSSRWSQCTFSTCLRIFFTIITLANHVVYGTSLMNLAFRSFIVSLTIARCLSSPSFFLLWAINFAFGLNVNLWQMKDGSILGILAMSMWRGQRSIGVGRSIFLLARLVMWSRYGQSILGGGVGSQDKAALWVGDNCPRVHLVGLVLLYVHCGAEHGC